MDALVASLDIEAWSPSQIRELFGILHRMLASSSGQRDVRWEDLISDTFYYFMQSEDDDVLETKGFKKKAPGCHSDAQLYLFQSVPIVSA